jgi:hypothetical protein
MVDASDQALPGMLFAPRALAVSAGRTIINLYPIIDDRVILRELGVLIRTVVFCLWHNNGAVAPHNLAKKHGTPTM